MSGNLGEVLVAELRLLLAPLADAIDDDLALERLFYDLGLDLGGLTAFPIGELAQLGQAVQTALDALDQIPLPPDGLDDLAPVLEATAAIPAAVEAIGEIAGAFPAGIDPPLDPVQLVTDALNLIVLRYLERRARFALPLLALLGVVRARTDAELAPYTVDADTGRVLRFPQATPIVDFAQLGALLSDPVDALKRSYLGDQEAAALLLAGELFPRLDDLVAPFGGGVYVLDPADLDAGTLGPAGATLAGATAMLLVPIGPDTQPGETLVGAIITLSPADAGGLGLVITPVGALTLSVEAGGWTVTSEIQATGGTIAFSFSEVVVSGAGAEIGGSLTLERGGAAGPALRLGGEDGTRLEIGTVRLGAHLLLAADAPPDAGFLAEVGGAALAIAAGDGDGFLGKILPPGGIVCEFELGVGYSTRRGLYFKGSARLQVQIPVHVSFFGIIDLETIDLIVALAGAAGDGQDEQFRITLTAAVTAGAHLGPLDASVEQIGVDFHVTFPEGGGNAGPANLAVGFHPPIGAGLVLDAGPVTGGGYILADHANGRYAGILQLEIADTLSVTAIGLVATRMPDGREGFSLLVIIAVEFPPIQLGYGFTLNGVGGLLGVNRSMAVEPLRNAARTRALDSVLFPPDPVANATKVIRDLEAMFPVTEGQFLIGLMVAIGWGSPTLIKVELGIILELPNPIRIALVGRATIVLPTEDAAVVELRIAVIGILDFGASELSVDASLYDSRVAAFAITGDFAVRLNYGASPAFALSAGGFNPRFTPPPGFPALGRVAISLATSDNPRLRVEAYMALTPTSVQMGARLEVYAEVDLGALGLWSVLAFIGFDALVYLAPKFSFIVDVAGGASIRRNGKVLFGAELSLTLSGPEPWHAVGYAEFEFLWAKRRIGFDETIGQEPPPPFIPAADPVVDLIAALGDAGNWSAQLPRGGPGNVTVRDPGDVTGELLVHPLGALDVAQKVVPLNVRIDRYAEAPVAEQSRTLAVAVTVAGRPASGETVRDAFPAGQFFALSEDAKLTGEQFPQLPSGLAGVRLPAGTATVPAAVDASDRYETAVVNPTNGRLTRGLPAYLLPAATLDALVDAGAAARAPTRATGGAAFAGAPLGIAVAEPAYRIVTDDAMAPAAGTAGFASSYEAEAARLATAAGAGLQVVGSHEAATP
ncbi:DUF6603 domain-containing protein [Phytohabitans rumicis]|uniref:DUF6603 domain-containing protein n=1 Tax=Phytohabitans rumicis TaxID=1076125 RepID=A0A6V8KNC2_9ACTN|nr:DUF6603 domain-containing protein [Phytohabitans rumicis]GFJ86663.1 hypothetical protein Prum_003050 [Phytohabitans rumicis]